MNRKESPRIRLDDSGFTLIELLIVIVIIAILAGLVIGVLNPVQQQNRARDATVKSSISKASLASKSLFVSSPRTTNQSPTPEEFFGGLGNAVDADVITPTCGGADNDLATSDATAADALCRFSITGITMPTNCVDEGTGTGTGYTGVDPAGVQCVFAYQRDTTSFEIAARGAARPESVFLFFYEVVPGTGAVDEGTYDCPTTYTVGSNHVGCTLVQ